MSSLVLLSLVSAGAAPLVPRWDEGSVRTLKIDTWAFAPGLHPWGTDWKITMVEQWTAVVECRPTAARVEVCTFPQGVWWGHVLEGTTELRSVNVGAPGAMEIVWTPRGRVSSFDVKPSEAFWELAANTILQATFRRADVVLKPDSQRQIGSEVERELVRGLAGALEWELAKKNDENTIWQLSGPPWTARRWIQGTANSRDLEMRVASEDAEGVHLALKGRVVEALPSDSSMIPMSAETQIIGNAIFDRTKGQIVSAFSETVATSTQPLVGHTRHMTLVQPWKPGDPVAPADMPAPLLSP